MDHMDLVSIIVPAYNAEKTIRQCVESLINQDYPFTEIIVINDASTDNTGPILSEYSVIKILETKGLGPSEARNLALGEAQGQYVAFTDADCTAEKSWLTLLFNEIKQSNVAGVGGSQSCPEDETQFGREIHHIFTLIGFVSDYMKHEASVTPSTHNPSCNVLYKKDILINMGGFKSDMWPGEDTDLDRRLILAGHKLCYNPAAIVYHYRPDTPLKLLKMMVSYGCAQASLIKHHGFFRFIHYVPILFLLMIPVEFLLIHNNVSLFFILNTCGFSFIYLFFLVKTHSFLKSIKHLQLFFIIIPGWLFGFFKNIIGFCPDVRQSRKKMMGKNSGVRSQNSE